MKDEAKQLDQLESRVDNLEERVAVIETTVTDMRRECNVGFTDIKQQLFSYMDERKQWGTWLRGAFDKTGMFVSKWGTIILCAALGLQNLPNILKMFGFDK